MSGAEFSGKSVSQGLLFSSKSLVIPTGGLAGLLTQQAGSLIVAAFPIPGGTVPFSQCQLNSWKAGLHVQLGATGASHKEDWQGICVLWFLSGSLTVVTVGVGLVPMHAGTCYEEEKLGRIGTSQKVLETWYASSNLVLSWPETWSHRASGVKWNFHGRSIFSPGSCHSERLTDLPEVMCVLRTCAQASALSDPLCCWRMVFYKYWVQMLQRQGA